ncbi:MAG: flagellar biosynthetic protein FliO [Balneolia bacterium]|nr:flagellar biosynthetic protein FliO [Balneolia bacterium]
MDLRKILSSTSASPQQVLKIVISVSVVLLVGWLFLVSRMELDTGSRSSSPEITERTDGLRNSISPEGMHEDVSSPNIFMNALSTFLLLVVVLIVVLILTKKWQAKDSGEELNKIGEHVIGQGAQLKILEMNEEIWVLGVTSSQVNLLHRYPKSEWKGTIKPVKKTDSNFYKLLKNKI